MPRMFDSAFSMNETEMQVVDLCNDDAFMARQIRPRETTIEISGIQRLANVFAQCPKRILQELVAVAVSAWSFRSWSFFCFLERPDEALGRESRRSRDVAARWQESKIGERRSG